MSRSRRWEPDLMVRSTCVLLAATVREPEQPAHALGDGDGNPVDPEAVGSPVPNDRYPPRKVGIPPVCAPPGRPAAAQPAPGSGPASSQVLGPNSRPEEDSLRGNRAEVYVVRREKTLREGRFPATRRAARRIEELVQMGRAACNRPRSPANKRERCRVFALPGVFSHNGPVLPCGAVYDHRPGPQGEGSLP